MNERSSNSMLSFEADTLFCELKEKFIFAMPRVVPDQRATYESDELFRKLSRECEVRYTGFRDRPMDERQLRFQAECREGHADVAFVCTGTTLQLNFSANSWSERAEDRVLTREYVDFDSEPGRVHLKSQFILNGVCVLWRGYIDLIRLDGMACLEFDRERAEAEASLLREQVEQTSRSVHQFEDRRRQNQLDHERQERQERQQACSEAEVVEALLRFSEAPQGGHSSCSPSSSTSSSSMSQHPPHHHHQQQQPHQHQHHQHHHLHHNDHNHNHHLS